MPTVIHVSPHPDDESIAAPCTLLALRDAGWRVINFAASLGRPEVHERREAELRAALDVAGFELHTSRAAISRGDDLGSSRKALSFELITLIRDTGAVLVVGPHARDGHHGHQTVARAIRQAVWDAPRPVTWWMWSIWADLPRPTLVAECAEKHLDLGREMLDCYPGETGRNDYRRMQESLWTLNAVRGVEKAFGFGSAPDARLRGITHAELFTEVRAVRRRWQVAAPRVLGSPPTLPDDTGWRDLDDISLLSSTRLRPLYQPWMLSLSARMGWPGRYDEFASRPRPWRQLRRVVPAAARSAWSRAWEKPRRS